MSRTRPVSCACLFLALVTPPLGAQSWLPESPYPAWGVAPPASVVHIASEPLQSPLENGARLHAAILALRPGQGLAIGPGVWSISSRLDLAGSGTQQAPYWLFAADPARKPVLTRPNASQNVVNIGSNAPARYWVLRDLEVTGGSDLIKLYDCAQVW